jgi:hypothetical protein
MQSGSSLIRSKSDPEVIQSGPSSIYPEDRVAKSLGWFSIGLGLAELFAARRVTHMLGLEGSEALVRAFGVREIASGVTTLSTEKSTGLWARLAGDALDLAALSRGLSVMNPQRSNVKVALLAVAGITVIDVLAATSVSARKKRRGASRNYSERSGFPNGLKRARQQRSPSPKIGATSA